MLKLIVVLLTAFTQFASDASVLSDALADCYAVAATAEIMEEAAADCALQVAALIPVLDEYNTYSWECWFAGYQHPTDGSTHVRTQCVGHVATGEHNVSIISAVAWTPLLETIVQIERQR